MWDVDSILLSVWGVLTSKTKYVFLLSEIVLSLGGDIPGLVVEDELHVAANVHRVVPIEVLKTDHERGEYHPEYNGELHDVLRVETKLISPKKKKDEGEC